MTARRGVVWLGALTAGLATYALALALSGGFAVRVGGLRLRSQSWERPAALAAAGAALLLWMARAQVAWYLTQASHAIRSARAARLMTAAAVAWTALAAAVFSTNAAGGSDSAGYAIESRMFAEGRLIERVPLARILNADTGAHVPLGFSRGITPDVIAPSYPPGLPLLMAPLRVFGERAIYLVVPAFGLLTIWLVFRLGGALDEPLAGALAALLLSLSPSFLFQLFQPLSDVPATACWLASLLLTASPSMRAAAGAGALAALAILIRPNLAPLAPLLLIALRAQPHLRMRRAVAFAAPMVPAGILLAWVQNVRYGSPFASGYGAVAAVFASSNVVPNLERYPRWLTETQTGLIWLWLLAPLWIHRRAANRRLAWTALALTFLVWASYLPYASFGADEWSYTRFLLPALPVMQVFAVAILLWGGRQLPGRVGLPVILALLLMTVYGQVRSARAHGIFAVHKVEQKYPKAGEFVRDHLPRHAVVFALQHSTSIRYYAGVQTLRWDHIDPTRLDETLETLRMHGFTPYAVIEAGEDAEFRRRFAAGGRRLHLSPLAVLGDARVYAFE